MENNNAHYLDRTNNGTTFVGSDVDIFALIVVSSALKTYATSGLRMNRAYTPKAMLEAAERYTGKTFKGKEKYKEASVALSALADKLKAAPRSA
jgi:hypothetical protein